MPVFSKVSTLGLALVCALLPVTDAAFAQSMGGGGGRPGNKPTGPVEVGVVEMQSTSVAITTQLPGRVAASATAEIRPQVGGIIMSVDFVEGSVVQQGDVLYRIDAATYEAQVAVAQAAVDKVSALVPNAEAKVTRYEGLIESGGVAQTDLADARVALAQARADVASAEANLNVAKINLGMTSVMAPISGIIGKSSVTQGALVTANQATAMVIVRQLDPIDVDLVESSSNLLRARGQSPNWAMPDSALQAARSVSLTLENGSTYAHQGNVALTDTVVSETTGTFSIRASLPNPDRLLLPGMFVRADVTIGQQANAYLVPQRAVTFNADGQPTALFVSADGKAETHVLTADRALDNAWVVTAGVADGDKLIVDGLQKISAGSEVIPLSVEIQPNGVIVQAMTETVPETRAGVKP